MTDPLKRAKQEYEKQRRILGNASLACGQHYIIRLLETLIKAK